MRQRCSCTAPAPRIRLSRRAAARADGPDGANRLHDRGPAGAGRRAQVGELHRGGVTLVSGVDSGIHPVKAHDSLPLAAIELTDRGVPATTALASATGLAARACGLARRTGRLHARLHADLLLVGDDPTTAVTAIRDVRIVVSRGRVVHTSLAA